MNSCRTRQAAATRNLMDPQETASASLPARLASSVRIPTPSEHFFPLIQGWSGSGHRAPCSCRPLPASSPVWSTGSVRPACSHDRARSSRGRRSPSSSSRRLCQACRAAFGHGGGNDSKWSAAGAALSSPAWCPSTSPGTSSSFCARRRQA